jgi:ubiquinone/menaquinone biosynthesis C-methylase UbiE
MNINPATATIEMLHKIAAHPWVYDHIQILAGREQVLNRILRSTVALRAETVVDVGGGTGAWRRLWPAGCRYVCLDIEMPKLKGFRSKVPSGFAVLSDATRMSIATESADVVMFIAVAHHLTDAMLEQVFDEALRVLRVGGKLILLDPVLNRELLMGRILWRLDRGSYPRTVEELHEKLISRFKVIHWEKFAIYHEYVLGIAIRT